MFTKDWKRILKDCWCAKLEKSLHRLQPTGIHLIAEERGKGEIHRFLSTYDRPTDTTAFVDELLTNLAELKLCDHDPANTTINDVRWVSLDQQA